MNFKENKISDDENITLNLLSAVELDSNITQRSLATELGIALGLANAYLKRCAEKGLVKIKQVPRNRYAYYITPRGFLEKTRIVADYLKYSLNYVKKARNEYEAIIIECSKKNKNKIILSDVSDLTEIVVLASLNLKPQIIGIIGDNKNKNKIAGIPLIKSFDEVKNFDVILITAINKGMERYAYLKNKFGKDKVILPAILGNTKEISR